MSKYYYLIAGLPNITLDDTKVAYTVEEFKAEIGDRLSPFDKKIMDLFYLKYDNNTLLSVLRGEDKDPDRRCNISPSDIQSTIHAIKEGEKIPANKQIPPYFITFIKQYLNETDSDKDKDYGLDEDQPKSTLSWEDRLSALYFAYAMKNRNAFIASWYELNLDINNILTAMTCRKYNLDRKQFVIGDSMAAEEIRTSNARDFGLADDIDYMLDLQRMAEEPDLLLREKKIDTLKWKWLEEHTFFKTFDIECLFTYLLKLEMIERWTSLDKEKGEKSFRTIIGSMRKGSDNSLMEFKKKNNK